MEVLLYMFIYIKNKEKFKDDSREEFVSVDLRILNYHRLKLKREQCEFCCNFRENSVTDAYSYNLYVLQSTNAKRLISFCLLSIL